MKPPQIIETPRLTLRPPVMEDDAFVFSYASDEDVARYMMWPQHDDIAQSQEFLERCVQVWEQGTAFPWIIEDKKTGEPLGVVELQINGHMANTGYVLSKPHWGKGYMTEAVIALRDWVMAQPGIYRFWSFCDRDNHASKRVMEKTGMQYEGMLRRWTVHPNVSDEPRDAACYSMVK